MAFERNIILEHVTRLIQRHALVSARIEIASLRASFARGLVPILYTVILSVKL